MSELKKSSKLYLILAGLLLGLLIVYALFRYIRKKSQSMEQETQGNEESDVDTFDPDKDVIDHYRLISQKLSEEGLTDTNLHKLVTAQAMHETGVFTSSVYDNNKNMFGMMQPSVRPTVSLGKKGNYASYANLGDSAKDYALYYKYSEYPDTFPDVKTFVSALKAKSYFTDNVINYISGVTSHYKKLNQLINAG